MSSIGKAIEPMTSLAPDGAPLEVTVVPDDVLTVELPDEDAGPDIADLKFNSNLALFMEDDELDQLGSSLKSDFEADKKSRAPWEDSLAQGMELLGLTFEDRTTPWVGACGVFHPLLSETLARFQASAIMEIFQPAGPVRTQIIGRTSKEKEELAERKEDEMNFILLEKMHDYRA